MALSLMRGKRVTLSKVDAFADGVAVKQVDLTCLKFVPHQSSIINCSTCGRSSRSSCSEHKNTFCAVRWAVGNPAIPQLARTPGRLCDFV